jgi:hypothetical protein
MVTDLEIAPSSTRLIKSGSSAFQPTFRFPRLAIPRNYPHAHVEIRRLTWLFRQIVAAGDQSAGKSSLLESLTGISFPRSVSLCTRFATEIICRREEKTSVVVSIHPEPGCSSAHEKRVRAFRRNVTDFVGESFAAVFKEAGSAIS